MATLKSNFGEARFQEILDKLPSLQISDLEQIIQKASDWVQKKKSPNFIKKETELIEKIKNGGPSEEFWKEYDRLAAKLEAETMTKPENLEFQELTKITGKWTYERLKLIIELAELWDTSTDDILDRLEIKPRERVYA